MANKFDFKFDKLNLILRQETLADHTTVAKVIEEAFKDVLFSDHKEHFLVERLRNSNAFIPQLSIVAVHKSKVVGHILLTKIEIKNENSTFESLAMAPVSVRPAYQNQGVGGMLIRESHKKAKGLGFQSIILLGHADFYPKFGYQPTSKFGIELPFEAPEENCMAIELKENSLEGISGKVCYPKEFYE